MKRKIVVIGGVAGGMSFATRHRRLNIDDEIIVFEKGPYVSFANCGLPYFISGEIKSRARLLVVREEELRKRFNLDLRANTEVVKINPKEKTVEYLKQDKTRHTESYDELVVATGAKAILPSIAGVETIPHFTLRNIPDLDLIMDNIKANEPKTALVIGGGFIGLEVAENLTKRGIKVSLVDRSPEVLPPFDLEMAAFAHEELVNNGVDVYSNNEVIKIDHHKMQLKSGEEISADFAIMALGVLPETHLLQEANIALGMRGGIIVDSQYRTSDPNIYAVGDAIIVKNIVSGKEALIALASPANRQGRQLADILNGIPATNKGSLGTAIVRIFNRTFASTGLNERQLEGTNYRAIHLQSYDHASYYPGASLINLKVLFDPETEMILGAQAVGTNGVDKRMDVLATAIKAKMKVTELQELELSYSPPFGSAKDIINLVGYVSQNVILGTSKTYQWYDVPKLIEEGALFLDVRNTMERFGNGFIEGSLHIEIEDLYERINEVPKDKKVVVYCESGTRSYNAERILRARGYDVYNLDGSYGIYGKMKGKK